MTNEPDGTDLEAQRGDAPAIDGADGEDGPPAVDVDAADDAPPVTGAVPDAEAVAELDIAVRDQKARDQVAKLLIVAEIATVICVDDNFEPELGVILDAIERASPEISDKVSNQLGVTIDGPPAETRAIWGPEVELAWNDCAEDQKRRYAAGVMSVLEEEHQPDVGRLGDLLADSVKFVPITGPEWEEIYKQQVLDKKTGKTLVLFDRAHGQDAELGIRLAADLHAADADGLVWAGLLTHTVDPADEIEQGSVLAAKDDRIIPERFVVISKKHLDAAPSTFPHGLKVTLMAPAAHRLRAALSCSIIDSAEKAAHMLKLDPYEFERAVFATAATEGIWEPDMLLRMFNVLIRAQVRKALYDRQTIADDAGLLRRFATVDLEPNKNKSFVAANSIRRLEVYEEPEHVNGRHLPIELGDIFQITTDSGTKAAVLVEQPCDLMVRSQHGAGKRGNDLAHAHLLELRDRPHAQLHSFELPAYLDGKPGYAWLTKLIVSPFAALDFCVYDGDGNSRLDTTADPPAGLWPAWEARHPLLVKEAKRLVDAVTANKVTALTDAALKADYVKHRCASHYATMKPISCTVTGDTVQFNLKRVNRLLQPYNRALLGAYSAFRARADFEPDFAASGAPPGA
jgi:hypothetical protein